MSAAVECPACKRKLKVPESLLGKSVRCPSCDHTFNAPPPDEPPPGVPAPVSTAPIRFGRTETPPEEDDEPRKEESRRRRRDRDDDDDDEDDRRARRRRYRRDRDDFEDEAEEDDGPPPRALEADWSRVRLGLSLLMASVLLWLGVFVFSFIGGCCAGASNMNNMAAGGGAPQQPGVLGDLPPAMIIVVGLSLLGMLAAWILKVGGSILGLGAPSAFGSRMFAVIGLALMGVEALAVVVQLILAVASNGVAGLADNPLMAGAGGPPGGAAIARIVFRLAEFAVWTGWLFIIGLYLRSIGLSLRNYSLAGGAKGWLITLGITVGLGLITAVVAVAMIGLAGLTMANQFGAMQAGKPQGPGAAGSAMAGTAVALCGLSGILLILALVLVVWYIILLGQARGSINPGR
jgi:predicted Zn finger-like uncharacterized protein